MEPHCQTYLLEVNTIKQSLKRRMTKTNDDDNDDDKEKVDND